MESKYYIKKYYESNHINGILNVINYIKNALTIINEFDFNVTNFNAEKQYDISVDEIMEEYKTLINQYNEIDNYLRMARHYNNYNNIDFKNKISFLEAKLYNIYCKLLI